MSLQTITEINLDINQPGVTVVHAKQYDTVRQVKAHLFYNGVKWLVPSSNFVAVVGFKKADRIGGFYDTTEDGRTAITVDGSDRSIIYILLDRNTVTTQGNVNTEITFYDSVTTGRLSTFSFITQVEGATVTELDLASNPYFNILAEDIREVIEATQSIAGLTAEAHQIAVGLPPTVTVTGGTGSEDPYNLDFGISQFPGMTASATKLAPNATPTATATGGTGGNPINLDIGVPSMPSMTASGTKLAPNATPTVILTGGQSAGQAYNINVGVPSMTNITASATRLAPGATPTATMSGGAAAGEAFNVDIGVPSMPGVTVSSSTLPSGSSATVTVTGGQSAGQAYNFAFGIPKGDTGGYSTISSFAYAYALSISGTTIPSSGWVNDPSQLGSTDQWRGKFLWTRTTATWSTGDSEVTYTVAYSGVDGSGAVTSVNGRDGAVTIAISDFFDYVAPI